MNADIPQWNKDSICGEEEIEMRKGRRKSNVENINKGLKGKSSEEEKIKVLKCSIKSHVETENEEIKESSNE